MYRNGVTDFNHFLNVLELIRETKIYLKYIHKNIYFVFLDFFIKC